MTNFQNSKTKENLARAFAAECQEGARYQIMAKTALQEGFTYLSGIIRTLAHNEMAHAKQFFESITKLGGGNVKNIEINAGYPFKNGTLCEILQYEAENEKMSAESIYPEFAKIAQDEGFDDISDLFTMISKVESSHNQILTQLHEGLCDGKLYKSKEESVFKCNECGNITVGREAPKTCPLCKMPQGSYRIDITLFE